MPDEQHGKVTWIPSLGEFESDDEALIFRGRPSTQNSDAAPIDGELEHRVAAGLALSSLKLADGVVAADVTLREVTPDSTSSWQSPTT